MIEKFNLMKSLSNKPVSTALVLVCVAAMCAAGCSNSSESHDAASKFSAAESNAMKSAAEAEAAEADFAKTKQADSHSGKRGVASVKRSKKPAGEAIYIVQVGTFKLEENAKKISEKLKSAGLPVFQKKIERENGDVLYAVRIEPTPNRVEADKFATSVKAATGEIPLVMSVGQ